jgi:hypothetical protein
MQSTIKPLAFPIAALIIALCLPATAQNKKLTAEDLVANHLRSIGSAEAIAAAKMRSVTGQVNLVQIVGGAANIKGIGGMFSAGPKFVYIMRFPTTDYPSEQMVFDGERPATNFLTEGRRSNLSTFLDQQNLPLREGLMGGTLSTTWPLLHMQEKQPRLDYRGLKKIEGKELHEMRYRPRKGSSDLTVTMYFAPETFRHVRSEYRFEIGAHLGEGPNGSTRNEESRYVLTEDFDDFRAIDGLTLPHLHRMRLSVQTPAGSRILEWTFTITGISHKEPVDDQMFRIR